MFGLGLLLNWKRLLIELGVAAVMIALGYWYFNYSQSRISALEADKASLTVAVDEQKKTIDVLQAFTIKQAKDIGDLQKGLSSAEADKAQLAAKLAKHDLEALAKAKPGLVQNRMNAATDKLNKELMDITGAP